MGVDLRNMGEVAHLLKTAEKGESPLQKKLNALGVRLGLISISFSILVFVIGVTTCRISVLAFLFEKKLTWNHSARNQS